MEHNYQQLVLFPHLIIAPEPEAYEIPAEPYEVVTQQQLSRAAALLIMVIFGVFLVGYTLGGSIHTKVYDGLIPSELYGLFFSPNKQKVVDEIKGAEYARVATLQEAVTLSNRLGDCEIVTRTSRSVSGEEKKWYQVLILKKGSTNDQ